MAHFDRVIPPGGEGKITLSVNTRGYRGKLTKSARVFTNDPINNVIRLALSAEIFTYVDLKPHQLVMRGDGTKKLTGEVQIVSHLDKPLELTPGKFSLDDKVSYTMEEIEEGRLFKLSFETKSVPKEGFRGHLELKTNFPEKPELRLSVSVSIRKPVPIKMSRRTLRLRGKVGEELSGEVFIETKSNEPLSLTPGKQTFPEKLTYVLEEVEKGKKFKVRFSAKPSSIAENYQGSLTLGTNYKSQPRLRIHVVVLVR